MPLIKPRTRGKQLVRQIVRLDRETNETLFAYAKFLGEPTDYVMNQVIDTVLAKDKEFQQWRAEHPESFVPNPANRSHRRVLPHLERHGVVPRGANRQGNAAIQTAT